MRSPQQPDAAGGEEALRRLFALPRFVDGDGRARLRRLIAPILKMFWWRGLDAIKITGSNGKGSVAEMCASILKAAGVPCGLYTSPHLRDPRERVVVGSGPIDAESFAYAVANVQAALADEVSQGEPGAFEAITAVALFAFALAWPETLVVEAGIGGRLDPTGVVPGSLTGLVSVDLEHTDLLGDTLEAIACDKADLADAGSHLVLGPMPPRVVAAVKQRAATRFVGVTEASQGAVVVALHEEMHGTLIDLAFEGCLLRNIRLRGMGRHQAPNAALAATLAGAWLRGYRAKLAHSARADAVRRGLEAVALAGRCERVRDHPAVYVDVAHTPASLAALADTLRQLLPGQRLLLVAGVAAGRDPGPHLAPLAPLFEQAIATRADHRGGDAEGVADALRSAGLGRAVRVHTPLARALEVALELAQDQSLVVVVAGGFFLAAEAIAVLEGRDPRALCFL